MSFQIGTAARAQTVTQPAAATNHPTYDLDPDAIQKLDRSGKGGKLSGSSQQPGDALSIGGAQASGTAPAAAQR